MNRKEYEKYKLDSIVKTFVQEEQFAQWLRKFFYLNNELHNEFDSIYQETFYVVFYELITIGLDYANKVFDALKKGNNIEKNEWYNELIKGLLSLKSDFSNEELEFIEYKRHSASHIFQNHYENRIEGNKLKTKRKGKQIDSLNHELKKILLEHGSDKNFDIYVTKKLYPKIIAIYNQLTKIKT